MLSIAAEAIAFHLAQAAINAAPGALNVDNALAALVLSAPLSDSKLIEAGNAIQTSSAGNVTFGGPTHVPKNIVITSGLTRAAMLSSIRSLDAQ